MKIWARGCWARVVTVVAITDTCVSLSDHDDDFDVDLSLSAAGVVLWNGRYAVTRIVAA